MTIRVENGQSLMLSSKAVNTSKGPIALDYALLK